MLEKGPTVTHQDLGVHVKKRLAFQIIPLAIEKRRKCFTMTTNLHHFIRPIREIARASSHIEAEAKLQSGEKQASQQDAARG